MESDFRKFQVRFMHFQYRFYMKSPAPDQSLAFLLLSLADTKQLETLYQGYQLDPDPENIQRIVFEYDLLDNYDERAEKLRVFIQKAKQKIKIQPIQVDGLEFSFPFDYVRDGNGKISPEILFPRWERILNVQSMKNKGYNLTQISQELGKFNEADIPNSLKPVKRDLANAKILIESAAQGTFPYPPTK